MTTMETVKAWKDEEYRDTLTADELAKLEPHPSGVIEFGKPQLDDETSFGPEASKCKFLTNSTDTGQCSTHSPGHCK